MVVVEGNPLDLEYRKGVRMSWDRKQLKECAEECLGKVYKGGPADWVQVGAAFNLVRRIEGEESRQRRYNEEAARANAYPEASLKARGASTASSDD